MQNGTAMRKPSDFFFHSAYIKIQRTPENLIYDDLMICTDDLQKNLGSNLTSD